MFSNTATPHNYRDLDFAFTQDKINPKQKDFGYCVAEKLLQVALRCPQPNRYLQALNNTI